MGDIYLVFSSSTMANRIKKLAVREGIRGLRVVQTPKAISQGCSYALRCPAGTVADVERIVGEYGTEVTRRYTTSVAEDGGTQYTML